MSGSSSTRIAELMQHPFFNRHLRPTRGRPARPVVVPDEDGCLIWQGAVNSKGYAAGAHGLAHRMAYAVLVEPIPRGYEIHHECRNKRCVNPDHLTAMSREQHALLEGRPLKLDEAQVREILALIVAGVPHHEIARRFGVTRAYVSLIKFGYRWANVVRGFWLEAGVWPAPGRYVAPVAA